MALHHFAIASQTSVRPSSSMPPPPKAAPVSNRLHSNQNPIPFESPLSK